MVNRYMICGILEANQTLKMVRFSSKLYFLDFIIVTQNYTTKKLVRAKLRAYNDWSTFIFQNKDLLAKSYCLYVGDINYNNSENILEVKSINFIDAIEEKQEEKEKYNE